jgi:alkaline phosphatase
MHDARPFLIRPVTAALVTALVSACATVEPVPERSGSIAADETSPAFWQARAEAALARQRVGSPPPPARNVILFIGDGMGVSTVTAARILAGQLEGGSGEEFELSFERFPAVALSKTYNVNQQTPDSAGTMTAMITGTKTLAGVLSVDASVTRGDCASGLAGAVPTLIEQAEDAGLATGVISTARITHATPGATFAHVPERDWEVDTAMPDTAQAAGCRDIARQLVEFDHGDGIEVVLGGGRAFFLPGDRADPEYDGKFGRRADRRDLVQEWQQRNPGGSWVWNRAQFDAIPTGDGHVLGLFEPSHMQFEADRPRDPGGEPSLAEMTAFAIERLQQEGRGFVLVVEGGRIDHGHHAGNAYRALTDAIAMADAVAVADAMTAEDDTLILVTADHSHTLTIGGYPTRGNPILGLVVDNDARGEPADAPATDALGLPFTTLAYANGPGYQGASDSQPAGPKRLPHFLASPEPAVGRSDLSGVDTTDPLYLQEATLPMGSETHGGEDVAVYARGPGAGLVGGVIEQNVIYYLLREALGGALETGSSAAP